MANPFTTGPFNCCTCPEPPDYDPGVDDPLDEYINTCGCPSVAVVCESEEKVATLCGFSEFTDSNASPPVVASVPAKKYLKRVFTQLLNRPALSDRAVCLSDWSECEEGCQTRNLSTPVYVLQSGYSEINKEYTSVFDISTCSYSTTIVDSSESEPALNTNPCGGSGYFSFYSTSLITPTTYLVVSPTEKTETTQYQTTATAGGGDVNTQRGCGFGERCDFQSEDFSAYNATFPFSQINTYELSDEDTEANALARETSTTGTSCSSIYELRTTLFSFDYRTVTYTATASNLAIGVAYEGCVRIRKREAYSGTPPAGADTEWEDVEPDTISSFTATDTEEEIAADVVVPNVQGYEYEVVSAHVWPVSVGCDCPTSYSAP